MDFGWRTGQKVSEWTTMFKYLGSFKNRADGHILRNRIQTQQKPQRRSSLTLRLNGCRADFQNGNIRVCCMDGIMDGTDILPLATFYPCECHRLFFAIGVAGYGKTNGSCSHEHLQLFRPNRFM